MGARFTVPVHTGPRAQPASCTLGTRFSFPGGKWQGRGVEHSSPPKAEVKERVELFLYSPSGPSWLIWVNFTFPWGVAEYEEKKLEEEEEKTRDLKICALQRIFLGLSNERRQISRTYSGHGKVRKSQKYTGKHQKEENLLVEDEKACLTLKSILHEQGVTM